MTAIVLNTVQRLTALNVAQVHRTITGSTDPVKVMLMELSGLVNTRDVFIGAASLTHPWETAFSEASVPAGHLLSGTPIVKVVPYTTDGVQSASIIKSVYTYPSTLTTVDPTFTDVIATLPTVSNSIGEITATSIMGVLKSPAVVELSATEDAISYELTIGGQPPHTCGLAGYTQQQTDLSVVRDYPSAAYCNIGLLNVNGPAGYCLGAGASAQGLLSDFQAKGLFTSVGSNYFADEAGFGMYTRSVEGPQTVNLPQIAGYSRVLLITAFSSTKVAIFCGYTRGEGSERVLTEIDIQRVERWSGFSGSIRQANNLPPVTLRTKRVALNALTAVDMFPLSWNNQLVSTFRVTDFAEVGQSTIVDANGQAITVLVMTARVIAIRGTLERVDYEKFMREGFGLRPVMAPAKVDQIINSWKNLEAIAYDWSPTAISGLTLKNTEAYKEYGRRMAKACKTNTYLTLKYNQDYSMAEVEAKLLAITGRNVIALDKSLLGSTVLPAVGAAPALPVLTLNPTAADSTIYAYSSSAGKTGTVILSPESVLLMLDNVMPCTFEGDPAAITAITTVMTSSGSGGSLADISREGSIDANAVTLTMSGQVVPGILSLEDSKRRMTSGQLAAFMASQVTDYQAFDAGIPAMLKNYTGTPLYNLIMKQVQSHLNLPVIKV